MWLLQHLTIKIYRIMLRSGTTWADSCSGIQPLGLTVTVNRDTTNAQMLFLGLFFYVYHRIISTTDD